MGFTSKLYREQKIDGSTQKVTLGQVYFEKGGTSMFHKKGGTRSGKKERNNAKRKRTV